jgi:hypothetical protein
MEHMKTGGDDEEEFFNRLKEFVTHAVMDPLQVYLEWYPWATQPHQIRGEGQAPAPSTSTPRKDEDADGKVRAEGDEESPDDRNGRIRFSALGALKWLIGAFFLLFFTAVYLLFDRLSYPDKRIERPKRGGRINRESL